MGIIGKKIFRALWKDKFRAQNRAFIRGSSVAIASIFLAEGVMVGITSWLISAPLSFPAGYLFTQVRGGLIFPMTFQFSWPGLGIWFLIVMIMAALASLWPAWRATRVSVRETLAYE
jgi:putative ABC transport system permease protein